MDLVCVDCGKDEAISIHSFGDVKPSYLCSSCGSQRIRETQPKRRPEGYQPPSVSQMTRRLRSTERNLEPTAMERAIAAKRWAEDEDQWREDLVALLNELEAE